MYKIDAKFPLMWFSRIFKQTIFIAASLLFISTSYAAMIDNSIGTLTGRLAATTDYSPRGLTQSDERPAIHGGMNYTLKNGLYFDASATRISYDYDEHAHVEVDLCPGIKKSFSGVDFDFSGCDYWYPNSNRNYGFDFFEYRGTVAKNFDQFYTSATVKYSSDFWLNSGKSLLTQLFVMIPVKDGFSFVGDLAHQTAEYNQNLGVPDYTFWDGGVSYRRDNTDYVFKYLDTDLSRKECPTGGEARITLTVMHYF